MAKLMRIRLAAGGLLLTAVFGLVWAATVFDHILAAAALWPVNALVLAFVLRTCPEAGAARAAVAAAVAAMGAGYLAAGTPAGVAAGLALAHGLEILLAVRLLGPRRAAVSHFEDLRRLATGAVVAAPLVSTLAVVPVLAIAGADGAPLARQAAAWFGAHAFGMAVVAPFALYATARGAWPMWRALGVPFAVALLFVLLSLRTPAPVGLLAFPLVMLAVVHDRVRGAALAIGLVTTAMLTLASLQLGLVHYLARIGVNPVAWIQVFFACLVATAYPLAVALKRLDAHAAEADARRSAAEADARDKIRLIGEVGEELRSPLSGVVTLAEMLRSGRLGALNARQRELLGRIADAGAEIETLSRDMMTAQPGPASRQADPADAAETAVRATSFVARRRGVTLGVQLTRGLEAAIDARRLQRMIEETLASAVAHARAGGRVELAVEPVAGGVRVRIEDDGEAGLEARMAAHQLARLDRAPIDGRAFDRGWLRAHGGDLVVAAGDLGGLRVDLLLPVREVEVAA
jgi:signal transduction histidine kinase